MKDGHYRQCSTTRSFCAKEEHSKGYSTCTASSALSDGMANMESVDLKVGVEVDMR